jgi:hypothetical protein
VRELQIPQITTFTEKRRRKWGEEHVGRMSSDRIPKERLKKIKLKK